MDSKTNHAVVQQLVYFKYVIKTNKIVSLFTRVLRFVVADSSIGSIQAHAHFFDECLEIDATQGQRHGL